MKIQLKRVYEGKSDADGFRVLTDRLWPRGISKEKAALDLWTRDIAPSNELRTWFAHDPEKWHEFKKRYFTELSKNTDAVREFITTISTQPVVTLLYGAKDPECNQAAALRDYLTHHDTKARRK